MKKLISTFWHSFLFLALSQVITLPAAAQVSNNRYTNEGTEAGEVAFSPVSEASTFSNISRVNDGITNTYATATSRGSATLVLQLSRSAAPTELEIWNSNSNNRPTAATVYGGASADACNTQIGQANSLRFSNNRATISLNTGGAEYAYVRISFTIARNRTIRIYEVELHDDSPAQLAKIQHKPAKWFDVMEDLGLSEASVGTFSHDKPWFETTMALPGGKIQAAHTYIDTIYVHKGSTVDLYLPDRSSTNTGNDENSVQTYQRWYSYRTDGTFETNHSEDAAYDLLTPIGGTTRDNYYRLRNGYVGWPMSTNALTAMTFYYPTDAQFEKWFYNHEDYDNDWYVVACDVSGYTDFWKNYPGEQRDERQSRNVLANRFRSNGFYEPTLTHRIIYYIVGVDDHTETTAWEKGHGRLTDPAYRDDGNGADKKYLEEYTINFPASHVSNNTDEMLALSKDAVGYAIPGVSREQDVNYLTVSIEENSAGIQLVRAPNESRPDRVSENRRVIQFRKQGVGEKTPWEVPDGSTATVLVTKTVGGTKYNIARFRLTFTAEDIPLTQHQVAELDKTNSDYTSADWYYRQRSPQWMDANLQLLTSLDFDYDPAVAEDYGRSSYFQFPMNWDYSSYAFFDGSYKGDYLGGEANPLGNQFSPRYGQYCIVNTYVGYGDAEANTKNPTPPTNVGKPGDGGYFMYIDVSDRPGVIAQLPFEQKLCQGSELYVTAWVKSAGTNADNSADAGLLFTIYGIRTDDQGNVTERTPIYRHSSSQIRTTTWLDTQNRNLGMGIGTNDWYQLYFSFINSDAAAGEYDSYVLQLDNNSTSSNGGDIYVDDIRVYLMQPSAEVAQLEATCSNQRTLMNVQFDWDRLTSRLGVQEGDTGEDAIDFCFVDQLMYNEYLDAHPGDEAGAIAAAAALVGNNETGEGGYNGQFTRLWFKQQFKGNAAYDPNDHPNLAINNPNNDNAAGKYYFYGHTDEMGLRQLVVDFYSQLSPNRAYVMLIKPRLEADDEWPKAADFTGFFADPCAIKTEFRVTAQTLLRVNGEVVDPGSDFCSGQIFNFSANVRVPVVGDDGATEEYIEVKDGVWFDWFFGSETEFLMPQPYYGKTSLMEALSRLRDIYPDVDETLEGVTDGTHEDITGQLVELTKEQIALIRHYLELPGPEGGVNHRLVLRRQSLDITLLDTLSLVVQPIPTLTPPESVGSIDPDLWQQICWDYVPLELKASGDAPQLHAGFNNVQYPDDDFSPALRIGLKQIEALNSAQNTLRISLRGAKTVTDGTDHLGLITSTDAGDVYKKIYLVNTDDPAYTDLFGTDFNEYSLPIGTITYLHAEPYVSGSRYNDRMNVYFDTQTTVDLGGSRTFRFQPKEGYTYTFAVHFEEKYPNDSQQANTCYGSFVVPMKVVPENVVWRGGALSNWNNDANWQRADRTELKKEASDSYPTNDENTTAQGFVPMLFSNVLMPAGSRAQLYMAGYTDGGAWTGSHNRPAGMEDPTEYIQYDLMTYKGEAAGAQYTTERYRVNICRDIHFETGAQLLHAEQLIYGKASTDVEVTPGRWTALSTPLQDVVAGDWYVPSQTGQEAAEYFTDITFSSTTNNRLNPAIYQRTWADGAKIVEQQGSNTTPVSFTAAWSAVYNDAHVPYVPGSGFSLKAAAVNPEQNLLVRLPKADAQYDVATGSAPSRTNAGRLLVTGLLDRSDPLHYNPQDEVTATLTPSPATTEGGPRYLMVGNPYMAPMSMQAFVEGNLASGAITPAYWVEQADGSVLSDTYDDETDSWTQSDVLIPPYGVAYVQVVDNSAPGVKVRFTADMQQLADNAAGDDATTQAFTLTATDDQGRTSRAAVAYSSRATDAYGPEDAALLTGLSGNATAAPQVYTVAGNTAVSVNWLKDAQQIPLGVFAATDDDEVILTFTGLGALRSPRLYDAELNTETLLSEGYQLTVKGSSHGRYFLRSLGGALTGLTPTTTDPELTVYSVRPGELIVSSNATLQSVQVFTADGRRLSPVVQSQSNCVWRLSGVDKGVVLIKATAGNRQQVVRKAMVK